MNGITCSLLRSFVSRKATALLLGLFTAAVLARVKLGLRHELLLVLPLTLLFLQLAVSLVLYRRAFCRRPGILAFHLGLLLVLVGAGWGRLTYLAAYFEVTEWGQCERGDFQTRQGPLYRNRLGDLAFLQDGVRVVRGEEGVVEDVVSQVALLRGGREVLRTELGYRRPLTYQGHHFYYAGERGLSLIFSYQEDGRGGKAVWAVNLPSYAQGFPQDAGFRLPEGGMSVRARLLLEEKKGKGEEGWDLSVPEDARVELTFHEGLAPERAAFRVGGQARLSGGVLTLEDIRLYNGYIIRYDPSLYLLLAASALSALGLIWELRRTRPGTPAGVGKPNQEEKGAPIVSLVCNQGSYPGIKYGHSRTGYRLRYGQLFQLVGMMLGSGDSGCSPTTGPGGGREQEPQQTLNLTLQEIAMNPPPLGPAIEGNIIERLKTLPIKVKAAAIYGSSAKRTQKEDSDIDLLLISDKVNPRRHKRGKEIGHLSKVVYSLMR